MALPTQSRVMGIWDTMAGLAVRIECAMLHIDLIPVSGIMALPTQSRVVTSWRIMTFDTFHIEITVLYFHVFPEIVAVTLQTISWIMGIRR